jgi:hypothetical protein
MKPGGVVEPDDVLRDAQLGLAVIGVVMLPDTLLFQAAEEALHHGIVPVVV